MTEQVKHTPGPWSIDDNAGLGAERDIIAAQGRVAMIESDNECDVANAQLIVLAPELLTQCKLFSQSIEYSIRVLENKGDDDEGVRLQFITLNLVNDLIARAEGQSGDQS